MLVYLRVSPSLHIFPRLQLSPGPPCVNHRMGRTVLGVSGAVERHEARVVGTGGMQDLQQRNDVWKGSIMYHIMYHLSLN